MFEAENHLNLFHLSTPNPPLKTQLHLRNKHRGQYDFKKLSAVLPELNSYIKPTTYGNDSINFFNPKAVVALNKALLKLHYKINFWEIPANYLCPPIPGRADYIHHVADLLNEESGVPKGAGITCMDLGVGASCVYPIIGNSEYGWSFIGCDIDEQALASSQKIIDKNKSLKGKVELRFQAKSTQLLKGIIQKSDKIEVVICNPPFHSSAAEATAAASKKASNLTKKRIKNPVLNFGGQQNELWCHGGEYQFVKSLIHESKQFSKNCRWFTTLISKKQTLKHMLTELEKVNPTEVKTIELKTGNKVSRVLCWKYHL